MPVLAENISVDLRIERMTERGVCVSGFTLSPELQNYGYPPVGYDRSAIQG